jgi:electron transport complex protein RnfC
MGSEKHLIYSCTGRKVPVGKLPADAGCVVQNVATALAVYEAVECNKPLYERVMTVSGKGCVHPKNLLVKFGTNFGTLREDCGAKPDAAMFVAGGPMMGPAMASTDVYTTKTSSGFLMLLPEEIDVREPTACINCGACADVCPMNLLPMQIDFYTQAGAYDLAAKFGGVANCISCGCCAYVCPAKRALTQSIALCKQKLSERR